MNHSEPKQIVVTGGAGMIGSNLCGYLLSRGDVVHCIDNIFSGRKQNIEAFLGNPKFQFHDYDINDGLSGFHFPIDEIYHLACPASPKYYQSQPVETVKTNVLGSINVLELARQCGAKVLLTSTSEVYGNPQVHPQPESYYGNVNPNGPRACYDEGKRCAETLFFDYHREFEVSVKVARIFNTYGPNMCQFDGRVVSNFIMQALAHQPITIYGDGSQTRSFCYVDDMVEGLVALMESGADILGPINLGNTDERSILTLAEEIVALCESDSSLVFCELPQDDPVIRRPDITRAKAQLGWQPHTGLSEGLIRTVAYFKGLSSD